MNLSMPPASQPRRRRRLFLVATVLVVLGLCFLVFRSERAKYLDDPRKVRVEVSVTAPYAGTVQEVLARPGADDLPAGTPLFSYDVAAMREELGAVEAHADSLARSLPAAARNLAGTPGAVSAALQERNLAQAQTQETNARLNLEAVSERLAQASVQVETLRVRLARGEASKNDVAQAVTRRNEARTQLQSAEKAFEQASLARHKQEDLLRALVDMERSLAAENTALYRRFAAYKAAVATVTNIRFALEHARVDLERGGSLTGIDIKPGDPVTAGQVVARLQALSVPVQLTAHGSFEPKKLPVGAEARVRLVRRDTGEERDANGTVTSVVPAEGGSLITLTLGNDPWIYEAVLATPESDIRVTLDR